MASSRRTALGLAWVVLVAGCGGSGAGDAPDSKLARAEALAAGRARGGGRPSRNAGGAGRARLRRPRCDAGKRQEVTSGYRHAPALRRGLRSRSCAGRPLLAPPWPPGGVSAARGASRRSSDRRSGLDVWAPALPGPRRGAALRRHPVPAGPTRREHGSDWRSPPRYTRPKASPPILWAGWTNAPSPSADHL